MSIKYLIILIICLTSCTAKFVNEPPVFVKHKLPIKISTQDKIYLSVHKKFNEFSGMKLIEQGDQYKVIESNQLDNGIDGYTTNDSITMREGLSTRLKKCIYAHEIGHALGHWNHGTCQLMQPKVNCWINIDSMIHDFITKWIDKFYN